MTRDGYKKHKDLIGKWAAGAEIQYFSEFHRQWVPTTAPDWDSDVEYRIKPNPLERWLVLGENGALYSAHLSEDAARAAGYGKGWRVVHMKEVIDE